MSGITKEKTRHDLDDDALGKYLMDKIPGLKLPIVSTKIGYGQSNPTYFIDDSANTRFILRKKPSGTIISPVAHQVDREYRVIKALGSVEGFPVPKVFCLCMDDSLIGTPFYVSLTSSYIKCREVDSHTFNSQDQLTGLSLIQS
jgi:aminoglycoside phosphotransferase (APT) family kinase protein